MIAFRDIFLLSLCGALLVPPIIASGLTNELEVEPGPCIEGVGPNGERQPCNGDGGGGFYVDPIVAIGLGLIFLLFILLMAQSKSKTSSTGYTYYSSGTSSSSSSSDSGSSSPSSSTRKVQEERSPKPKKKRVVVIRRRPRMQPSKRTNVIRRRGPPKVQRVPLTRLQRTVDLRGIRGEYRGIPVTQEEKEQIVDMFRLGELTGDYGDERVYRNGHFDQARTDEYRQDPRRFQLQGDEQIRRHPGIDIGTFGRPMDLFAQNLPGDLTAVGGPYNKI